MKRRFASDTAQTTLGDLPTGVLRPIVRNLLTRPLHTFVIDDWRQWRGIELYTAAVVVANEIERRTRCPRIGLMLPTSGLFPMAAIGAWLAGRTVLPVNYLLKPAERDATLRDAGLDLVITVSPMFEMFGGLPPGVDSILLDHLRFPRLPRFRWPPPDAPDLTAALVYTSGTSGDPKGVELTARNLAANVWQCARWGEVTRHDVFLGVLPQFHSFGLTVLTLLPLYAGARVVYTARFVPRQLFELLRRFRPTGFVGVPAMYEGLLTDKKATPDDFRSVRLLICGGEPLSAELSDRFARRFGISINQGYGLTETGPVANWTRAGEMVGGSVGRPLPFVNEKIIDADGVEVASEVEGEICIRGPNVMKGYFKRPQLTTRAFDGDGYFRTGDLGRIDTDGRLFITGRKSELIVVAGENVVPAEIERVLDGHPSIHGSAVIGVPDRLRGQVPVAFVQVVEGASFDETALRTYCRGLIARHKVPRRIVAIDELPRSPTGKVLKRLLPLEKLQPRSRRAVSRPSSGV